MRTVTKIKVLGTAAYISSKIILINLLIGCSMTAFAIKNHDVASKNAKYLAIITLTIALCAIITFFANEISINRRTEEYKNAKKQKK